MNRGVCEASLKMFYSNCFALTAVKLWQILNCFGDVDESNSFRIMSYLHVLERIIFLISVFYVCILSQIRTSLGSLGRRPGFAEAGLSPPSTQYNSNTSQTLLKPFLLH